MQGRPRKVGGTEPHLVHSFDPPSSRPSDPPPAPPRHRAHPAGGVSVLCMLRNGCCPGGCGGVSAQGSKKRALPPLLGAASFPLPPLLLGRALRPCPLGAPAHVCVCRPVSRSGQAAPPPGHALCDASCALRAHASTSCLGALLRGPAAVQAPPGRAHSTPATPPPHSSATTGLKVSGPGVNCCSRCSGSDPGIGQTFLGRPAIAAPT